MRQGCPSEDVKYNRDYAKSKKGSDSPTPPKPQSDQCGESCDSDTKKSEIDATNRAWERHDELGLPNDSDVNRIEAAAEEQHQHNSIDQNQCEPPRRFRLVRLGHT